MGEVEQTFDLVMMADRFDESMILMKDLLCWDYEDIVNFKLNARKESKKVELSDEARSELRKYLASDYRLYDYFQKIFQQKLNKFGKTRMEQELRILRNANNNMKTKCGLVAYKTQQESDSQCKNFAISEMNFIEELREIQADRAGEKAQELNLSDDFSEDYINSAIKKLPNIRSGPLDIEKLKAMYIHS